MKKILLILMMFVFVNVNGQINLTIEGIDSITTTHNGYEISRSSPTNLIFRYSRIRTALDDGYLLMAGDNNYYVTTATNLDGAQIYGSRFISTNTTPNGSLHGLMVGYNANYDIHHNYISTYNYGLTNEGGFPDGTSTVNTSGGLYYNIFKNNVYNIVNKGHDGTKIINNTFYSSLSGQGVFIGVKESDTGGLPEPYPGCKNTKIMNNIFYYDGSFSQFHAIAIGSSNDDTLAEMDTFGLEIDYNIYFYKNTTGNKPFFAFNGVTLTWEQWRALGYDEHSIILDPNFIDFEKFVPSTRLDYGTPIAGFDKGLSNNYEFIVGESPSLTTQSGNWQVGAVIYETPPSPTAYYVSTTGSDLASGNFQNPWRTWQHAFTNTPDGDTCYIRGGVYQSNVTVIMNEKHGTRNNPTCFFAYPGEKPVIDFATKPIPTEFHYGVRILACSNVHIKGLTGRNVYQYSNNSYCAGIFDVTYSNNIKLEQCVGHDAGGTVFQISSTDTIYVINCDAYNANDPYTEYEPGGGGFGYSWDQPNQNGYYIFKGCRAWNCSDDGFGGSNHGYIEVDSCWSMHHGFYLTNTVGSTGSGYKMGIRITDPKPDLNLVVKNSIAAYNKAVGFTPNDNQQHNRQMHIYNNFIYHNGIDHGSSSEVRFGFFFTNKTDSTGKFNNWIRNNISYNNYNKSNIGDYYTNSPFINHENNFWLNDPRVTDADFVSLDTTGMRGPRQSNGNLPYTTFGHLARGSDLIDAGTTNTGLPYNGSAPDVGWVESNYTTPPPGSNRPGLHDGRHTYYENKVVIIK
jgi:hypothetical protein